MKEVRDTSNILFFFDNFKQKQYLLHLETGQDIKSFDSESVQKRVLEELGDDVVDVCLSLADFKNKISLNKTRPINNCLSVITVPADQVMADENDPSQYFFGGEEKRTTRNFQIHYSLIFRDWDSFLKGSFFRLVHKPYENLYQLISQNACMKKIISEVSNILNADKPSQEKAELCQLISSNSELNPLMLYKQLNDNSLQDHRDRLLIQCMLNVMAFSQVFYDRALSVEKSFKAGLLSFFNTNLVTLPSVVNETVVDYLAGEAADLAERRKYTY